jgi:ABC-type sugar transport system permease subunit
MPPGDGSGGRRARRRKEVLLAYALLAPSGVIIAAFGFLPLLNALLLSLRDWRLQPGPWVGFRNYALALFGPGESAEFWRSLGVTVYYVAGTVPLTIVLGYLLAELLHSRLRGLAFYRTLFFIPYVASPVAAAAVWRWLLNPNFGLATAIAARFGAHPRWLEEETGVLALLGSALHAPVPEWAAGPSLALVCIVLVTVWHNLGFAVVVLLAGLSAVPGEVTEAARLDGARGWSLMRRVKIPLLSPTLFFLTIVFTIRAFQMFTQIYMLSPDNRPGPTTRNITLYIVQTFNEQQPRLGPGYGAAVAVLLFLIILLLTLIQFRLLGRRVHYG